MLSSDRIKLYIGTYTRRESFVDGKAEGIYIYHLDPRSGELTYAATVAGPGTINPSFLTLGPDKRCLYAVNELYANEGPHGTVSAFAIDPVTKDLIYLNQQSTCGLAPCYASIEPKGVIAWWQTMRPAASASYRSGKTGAWARLQMSCSFPAQGPIARARRAHMPIWLCLAQVPTRF